MLLTARPALGLAPQQQQQAAGVRCPLARGSGNGGGVRAARRLQRCRAEADGERSSATQSEAAPGAPAAAELDKEVSKFARSAATTFAPRASGATGKNPAYKGSVLYTIFEVQAWAALAVGGLLSFNLIFPSDQPDIARLLGMWSIWMFTIPSLRARECTDKEKDALNLLFLAVPLLNVALPFVWKSFPFIFSADCVLMAGVYVWKGLIPGVGGSSEQQQG
ncbi:hypothetical protein C2E20_8166 [Micractinium conductrix]|uniref:Resistance to phytophthora 1 n=1 Tax=Micractinium conductrix TaxID=554055 RepID=A0A2P6V2A9_9CHLO|nr:hypothetical protein C2E20_8166 [Micractinium conductrix]|eukprot:PSC68220.1 hypothetical protein C2E20_8166 [Micractinium conductrix]